MATAEEGRTYRDQQPRPRQSVADAVHPLEDHKADTDTRLRGLGVLPAEDGHAHEEQEHATRGGEEERATTNAIDQHGAGYRDDEIENGATAVEAETSVVVAYADRVVDTVRVVRGEGVA